MTSDMAIPLICLSVAKSNKSSYFLFFYVYYDMLNLKSEFVLQSNYTVVYETVVANSYYGFLFRVSVARGTIRKSPAVRFTPRFDKSMLGHGTARLKLLAYEKKQSLSH